MPVVQAEALSLDYADSEEHVDSSATLACCPVLGIVPVQNHYHKPAALHGALWEMSAVLVLPSCAVLAGMSDQHLSTSEVFVRFSVLISCLLFVAVVPVPSSEMLAGNPVCSL